jgi:hypothetical protein
MRKRDGLGFWQPSRNSRRPGAAKNPAPAPRPYGEPGDLRSFESTPKARAARVNLKRAKALLDEHGERLPWRERILLRKIAEDYAGKRQVWRDRRRLDALEAVFHRAKLLKLQGKSWR